MVHLTSEIAVLRAHTGEREGGTLELLQAVYAMYIGYIFIIVNKKHMLSIYPAHITYNIFYLLSTLISKIKKKLYMRCICTNSA